MDLRSQLVRFCYIGNVEQPCYVAKRQPFTNEQIEEKLSFLRIVTRLARPTPADGAAAATTVPAPVAAKIDIKWPLTELKRILVLPPGEKPARNDEAILALAYYAIHIRIEPQADEDLLRQEIYATVPTILQSPDDLFLFVHYKKKLAGHGLSRGTRGAIKRWYEAQSPMQLAEMLGKNRSHHSWEHADIIKLAHVKFADDRVELCKAVFQHACKIVAAHDNAANRTTSAGMERLILISKLKVCESPTDAVKMIRDHKFCIENVPAHLLLEYRVWEELIPNLTYNDLLHYLPFMYDNEMLLAKNVHFCNLICEKLGDHRLLKAGNVHPLHILVAYMQHESGKRYHEAVKEKHRKVKISNKTLVPNQEILKVLLAALDATIPRPTMLKRAKDSDPHFFITLDLRSGSHIKEVHGLNLLKNVELMVLMAWSYVKREKNVTVMAYTKTVNILQPINITRNMTYHEALIECGKYRGESTTQEVWAPIRQSILQNRRCNVFMTFLDSCARSMRVHNEVPVDLFKQYKKLFHLTPKYVVFNLSRHHNDVNVKLDDFNAKGIMEVCGFNLTTPSIVDAFVNSLFF